MKNIITILSLILFHQLGYGQISTTEVVNNQEKKTTEPYDSLQNFLSENANKYIGQELYLKGKSESLRKYGYNNFLIKMGETSNKENIYKCCDGYNSSYDSLNKRYFSVLDVIKKTKNYGTKFYLKLKDKKSNDILYFDYDSRFESSFPFITVGFFEKKKGFLKGTSFIFGDGKINNMNDITTGKPINYKLGQEWKYVELTIEQKYYTLSAIIENEYAEKIAFSYNSLYGENSRGVFELENAEKYIEDYDIDTFNEMLNGKVLVGFTEKMVINTWGKPNKINRASYGDQWVYDGQYLYFENGKLKSFN
jgi:hypothetical protein